MPTVHSSAVIEGEVELADDVFVGPGCVLRGPMSIGAGCRLLGQCWLQGPLRLGARNTVYPFVSLGFAPQDLKWDPDEPGAGLVVGEGNTFREGASIHRATSPTAPTTIGDRNYFMACTHAGHDCRVGNDCVFANGTLFGGHVQVGDRVVTGGTAVVHQHCRIGRGCMLSGSMATSRDLPPWFTLTGSNIAGSINLLGLRRSGADQETIEAVRWVYRTLYRRGASPKAALPLLRERESIPIVREYIEFIESSRRGICPSHGGSGRRGVMSFTEETEQASRPA